MKKLIIVLAICLTTCLLAAPVKTSNDKLIEYGKMRRAMEKCVIKVEIDDGIKMDMGYSFVLERYYTDREKLELIAERFGTSVEKIIEKKKKAEELFMKYYEEQK